MNCKPRSFNADTQAARAGSERWLQQWSNETQKNWWHLTPQGSLAIPMDILRELEIEEGEKLFTDKQNLKQFGWVYAPSQDRRKTLIDSIP